MLKFRRNKSVVRAEQLTGMGVILISLLDSQLPPLQSSPAALQLPTFNSTGDSYRRSLANVQTPSRFILQPPHAGQSTQSASPNMYQGLIRDAVEPLPCTMN